MTQPLSEGADAKERATQLLYQHIDRLPHEEVGVINYLPFQHDSEQIRTLKRQTCEAIVNLLASHGCLAVEAPQQMTATQEVKVVCRQAGDPIVRLMVKDGVAVVNARNFIETVANTNPECPHAAMTLDDMRLKMQADMEREIAEQKEADNA